MPKALVISNLHAPDLIGGYEMIASECMDALERQHGWDITCHGAVSGKPFPGKHPTRFHADMTGYFPRGIGHHHALIPAGNHLRRHTTALVEKLEKEAREADVTLLFNPRRLCTRQWVPALQASSNAVAWVSDHWPAEYPDCDKLWTAAESERFSWSPAVMYGAAQVRSLYGRKRPSPTDLSPIRKAAFVSDFILRKNAGQFPQLEAAEVIRNGVDPVLFPYAEMTPARAETWGFCGRISRDKGVALALDLFGYAAHSRPTLRFLLAGDMSTGHGAEIRKKIENDPVLRARVTLLGKVSRHELAAKFYHRVGTLLFTSLWDEPFALTVVEAMRCGTRVIATATGGTPELVSEKTGYLIDPARIEDARSLVRHLSAQTVYDGEQQQTALKLTRDLTVDAMAEKLSELGLPTR